MKINKVVEGSDYNKNKGCGFLLGIDTGSSKTHALIASLDGKVLGYGKAGCGNYEVVGLDHFKSVLKNVVDDALNMAGVSIEHIISMGLGISGYDWPSEEPLMHDAIQSIGVSCDYAFENDVTIGLIAGSSAGWGVAVDAGTGNNVRGRDRNGRIGRITGNSVWHGEIGGGSEMVWLAQVAVTHAWMLRGPSTLLTQSFMKYCDVDSEFSLIEGLATGHIQLPPVLAEEIFRLAKQGDQVANQIIETSAVDLALNVNAVVRQLNLQEDCFELVLIGSVFKAGDLFLIPFQNVVKTFSPGAQLVHLTSPPVIGAICLAAEPYGIVDQVFKQCLINSLQGIWDKNLR